MGNQKDSKVYDIEVFRKKDNQSLPTQVSGEVVNFSGIYRLEHTKHPVARELVLLKGTQLPSCPACNDPITFTLVRQANEITDDPDFA